MSVYTNERTSVSTLMGMPILDAQGHAFGRVREFAVAPLDDATRVRALVVRRANARRNDAMSLVPVGTLRRAVSGELRLVDGPLPELVPEDDRYLMLERDLLDQQIIDVHGHKVVRVNDVDMVWEQHGEGELSLRIAEVEVGVRGALRRLLKGLPAGTVEQVACAVRATVIPWDFVDLIDRDPARRVRLKIEQERLAKMHPSDLADILEELAPEEGRALFSSLDEEVAAETLEEVELKTQKSLIALLDSERAAGIIEEMDPGAAADLLAELSDERSEAILDEMNEKDRQDVEELLDHAPDSAAGLMTTDYVVLAREATAEDALDALRRFDGDTENVTDLIVTGTDGHVAGVLPLARLMLAERGCEVGALLEGRVVSAPQEMNGRKVAELFDKYNLRCLPVVDEDRQLVGVIHSEHVIAWLRNRQ